MTKLYPQLLSAIKFGGKDLITRGKAVREVENFVLTLENPLQPTVLQANRKFNAAYAIIEALSLFMPGKAIAEDLVFYNSRMENYRNPKTKEFDGSYAERLTMYDQLRYCCEVLEEDPNTRRAVLDFYNAAHDQHESLDIACTLNMTFRIRDGKLNATTFMRGNDALWGTPYNFMMFTFLQNVMAAWLDVKIGTYTHMVGSMHIYEDKFGEADLVIQNPDVLRESPIAVMPKWDIQDVDLTFREISDFFQMQKIYRQNYSTSELDYNHLREMITSTSLTMFWDEVVKPYADNKLAKLA